MTPEYNPDYGNPYYDDENWEDVTKPEPEYVPDEPEELPPEDE